MNSIAELALRGHFEELRKEFNAKNDQKPLPEEVLAIISRVIGMVEDFYEHDPHFFTSEHKKDYQSLIRILNKYGYGYNGHPDLTGEEQIDKLPGKKPMQKAGITKKEKQKRQGTG